MCKKAVFLISIVFVLGLTGRALAGVPEGTLLIGWHTPEVSTPTSDSTPDDYLTGVAGLLSGGQDVQADKNSTDGNYGSGPATAASTSNAIRARLDQPSRAVVSVQITNNTGGSLYLGTFHFDYSRWYGNSPQDIALYYDSGDLDNDDNTLINSASELAVAGPTGDYDDFDWSLSVLNDVTLDNGQSATFRLEVSNSLQADTAGGFDNIAITAGVSATKASGPSPAERAKDVLREVVLSWTPGQFGDQHDVYFGTSFDDVNDAANLYPMGPDNIYRVRQGGTSYAIDETLDFGQTYYWRVDEVNAPPNSNLIFKGDVWSFTVEPFAVEIPGENIIVTASSSNRAEEGPENTINGSGLDDDDLHSVDQTDMWLSNGFDTNATWIQYEFDRVRKLYQMFVWNYNTTVDPLVGFGIKEVTIEYSVDGTNWAILGTTHEFARGPGSVGYAPNTTVDLSGVSAKYIRITANSNWGGILNQYGLSEVRFLHIPVLATEPSPDPGATDVDVDVILNWRAGREAARHDVYLSTDEQAVIDGNAPVITVTEASYAPSLDLAGTYYWRVDEVNEAETPLTWQGDVWDLSTQEYVVVDDFESYNDIAAEEEGSDLIYLTWIDGFDNPTANGSTMGYTVPFEPSMETDTVHGGAQSAPMMYNNSTAALSEVTRTFAAQNWTVHGVQTLSLWFFGDVNNVPGQLYVKVNGAKVAYDGDSDNLRTPTWQPWNIDLASIGVNLQSVTSLTIGIEGGSAAGTLLLDDIRLYPYPREVITPVQPDATGLVGSWAFDGDYSDASGNGHNGTPTGAVSFASDPVRGQVLSLPGGEDQFVDLGSVGISGNMPRTIACWAKADSTNIPDWSLIFGFTGQADGTGGAGSHFNIGSLGGPGGVGAHVWGWEETIFSDDEALEWRHYAMTYDGTTIQYYGDGVLMDTDIAKSNVQDLSLSADRVYVGSRITHTNSFEGKVDDALIYDRVLSYAEIAGLAGRTESFDKPF